MSRIKTLYTYLIINRQAHLDGWREGYEDTIKDVKALSAALIEGKDITSKEAYAQTSFADKPNPWESFARYHLYEKSNGVASRGQSVLSEANLYKFIADKTFKQALTQLIQTPDKLSYPPHRPHPSASQRTCVFA